MADPTITIIGNLTADPELRFTQQGKAVANITVAANHRVKKGDSWEDGTPTFYRCAVWEGHGENVAETLRKGMQVIVTGTVYSDAYTDRDGNERTSLNVQVEAIGPALRFQKAAVQRVQPGGQSSPPPAQQSGQWGNAQSAGFSAPPQQAPQQDPWSGGQQASAFGDVPQGQNPPF